MLQKIGNLNRGIAFNLREATDDKLFLAVAMTTRCGVATNNRLNGTAAPMTHTFAIAPRSAEAATQRRVGVRRMTAV